MQMFLQLDTRVYQRQRSSPYHHLVTRTCTMPEKDRDRIYDFLWLETPRDLPTSVKFTCQVQSFCKIQSLDSLKNVMSLCTGRTWIYFFCSFFKSSFLNLASTFLAVSDALQTRSPRLYSRFCSTFLWMIWMQELNATLASLLMILN